MAEYDIFLGADPEFALFHRGKPVPAHLLNLPPKGYAVSLGTAGHVLRDGWMVELNPSATYCRGLLQANVRGLIRSLQKKYSLSPETKLIAIPTVNIPLETLEEAPQDVCEFGCHPSWNAYSESEDGPHLNGYTHSKRYCGGHMHISGKASDSRLKWAKNVDNQFLFIRLADTYVGLLTTYLTGSREMGQRRKYYGRAGEFRFQAHKGWAACLEYRTPGPEIFADPALMSLSFGLFKELYTNFHRYADLYNGKHQMQVVRAINKGLPDKDLLDLIPEAPNFYTKPLLKKAQKWFQSRMRSNLFTMVNRWGHTHSGWTEFSHDLMGVTLPAFDEFHSGGLNGYERYPRYHAA